MQHIPVVSHAAWRGTRYCVETVDVVPTAPNKWLIPSTGLGVFIYRGRRASQGGRGGGGKRAAETPRPRRLHSGASSCASSAEEGSSGPAGQQWFLCTFSRVCANVLCFFFYPHPPSKVPPQPACPYAHLQHPPSTTSLQAAFFSCSCFWQRRRTLLSAKKQKKKNFNISYKQFLYAIQSPKGLK